MDAALLLAWETRRQRADAEDPEKAARRHGRGMYTARERIRALTEPGTFLETGRFAGDGVVTGTGSVDSRPVSLASQDFLQNGGTLGAMHAEKICEAMDFALKNGMPFLSLNDSGGARIQEGVNALSGYGRIFQQHVRLSGVVPQIGLVLGPCAGGAAYAPALMDFVIMTQQASLFCCGPRVITAATGEKVSREDIGTAEIQESIAGNVHFTAGNDEEALALVRRLLSFLPSNNLADPPHDLTHPVTMEDDDSLRDVLPANPRDPFDMCEVIRHLTDGGDFLESQKHFAPNFITAFGRIDGVVTGILANQPKVLAGAVDRDAADKGARFARFCDAFNIPLLSLVDVPGFLPGREEERGGLLRHGAKLLYALADATVPKLTLILRKAYGGTCLAMGSKDLGADMVWAWPGAEIAVMGAAGAVDVLHRKELAAAADPEALRKELISSCQEKFASPWPAAEENHLTDLIDPASSRAIISLALRHCLGKRETRPAKKHGNMPL